MKDYEYKALWAKGQKELEEMDHSKVLESRIARELDGIIHFPEQPLEKIREYQLNRLKKLVDYAYINIPLYREKYSKVGFRPGDIHSFEDFERLPFLYKEELIEGFPNKIVKDLGDFKYSVRSSGSSGKFVTVSLDLDAIYDDTLQGYRQYYRQSDFHYKKEDRVLFIYTCPWWVDDVKGNFCQDFIPTTMDPKDALEYIKKTRPFIISTYPTYLQKICELNVKLCDFGVGYVIVNSEQSSKKTRDAMAEALGVIVLDEYSSEELTRIALECHRRHYHLEEDACYIEVVDVDTKEKIKNGTGIVVGTNLINKSTPIIRYMQSDIVTIDSTTRCKCGNNARILKQIQGREMDCIISNGRKIPASSFMDLAYNWFLVDGISIIGMRYQIAQTAENHITVYLQKGVYELMKGDLDKIKESLYTLVDRNMEVDIVFTESFIQNTTKFKPVIRTPF